MDNSATEILVEMQKAEPTGWLRERSCQKVSFAAPALHKHCYLTFRPSQKNFVFTKILSFPLLIWDFFLSGAGLRHQLDSLQKQYYREKVNDSDPERSYTKAKVEKRKSLNIETVETELSDKQTSSCSSKFRHLPAGWRHSIFRGPFCFAPICAYGCFWAGKKFR